MKKKILFTLYHMNVGGVEKAFLGLLNEIPQECFEVHIAFIVPEGGFMGYIPSWVHVHTIKPFYRYARFLAHPVRFTRNSLLRGRLSVLPVFAAWLKSKAEGSKAPLCRHLLRRDDALGMEFDLAVSYASPHEYLDYYVAHHIKARKRAFWVHFDVSKFFISTKSIAGTMNTADRIFVVSETGRQIFNSRFPALASRTVTFHNIISPEMILADSRKPSAFRRVEGALNVVTVGRINVEKGQNLAIAAVAMLNARGIRTVLHLVGSGRIENACRQQAIEAGIDDNIRFYGARTNPYPYMAGADIYLQPSLHEGYCITLAEAKIFDAPIVATDFTGAREQLATRPNAVIAEDFTPEAIAAAIEEAAALPRCKGDTKSINDIDRLLEIVD